MTQANEAIARYHKLIESEPYRDMAWVEQLHAAMAASNLELSGRPVSSFLRPNFMTKRQYANLVKAGESLSAAVDRMRQLVIASPALMSRLDLLPGERMLAELNPGYKHFAVTSLLDSHINNGSMQVSNFSAEAPVGVLYQDLLTDLFYDAAPVKEFRKKHKLTKLPSAKYLQSALLKAYKEFGGKKQPNIAILEFRQQFPTVESRENELLKEYFTAHGHPAEVVTPEQLEYRNGVLRKGEFEIHLIYRRLRTEEFLIRYDLTVHPLVRAYREGAVCVVNSFHSDIARRRAMLELLTDAEVTAKFPAAEKKAIASMLPVTRVMGEREVKWKGEEVDLVEFAIENREKLVLLPNAEGGELPEYIGPAMDDLQWERAVKRSLRERYVLQEVIAPVTASFPVSVYGTLEYKDMRVEVHPHLYMGKVQSASSWLTPDTAGFSTAVGVTPTFLLG
jgi:hypothetical protein